MIPDLCIYHGGECLDGFAAAWVVWRKFGDSVKFHAGVYGKPAPDVTGLNVAIVDFSYKRPEMITLAKSAKNILVLDHHKTAAAELLGLEDDLRNAEIVFEMQQCGSMLAWQHYFPGEQAPLFLAYIQDRDLWTKKIPGVEEFTSALRSYPMDFGVWNQIILESIRAEKAGLPEPLISEGVAIQRYFRTLVESTKKHAHMREIAGYTVPVVNASLFLASEVCGELCEENAYRFAAMYAETATDVIWSLRSRGDFDVSEVARKFGGGGHKNAAGFTVPRP
jgi:oligoribonuclease NrnB/cAMP/cGMP phosphodiesterase (DHH superfamily)